MVDERQRQRQMMTTDPNRQHYGPAGGPNRWTMDYPAEGMPTNYRGHSPNFRSGNLDVRYPGDFNAQQMHRRPPSNRQPLLNQPPMERPSYDWPGQPSYGEWMQSIDPNREGQPYSPKQHPNPRMRGMMGGIGGLQEQAAVDPSDWRTILRILEAGGDPGTETAGIGSTDEYQMAELSNKQGNFMESGLGNPNWYSNFPDYFDTVTGKGDWKQKLGWKDEATEQEVIDKLNQMMLDRDQSLPWSTTT